MMNTRLQNRLTETEILKIFSDTVEVRLEQLAVLPPFARTEPAFSTLRPSRTCITRTHRSSIEISKSKTSSSPLLKLSSSAISAARPLHYLPRRSLLQSRRSRNLNLISIGRLRCSIVLPSWWMSGDGKGLMRRLVSVSLRRLRRERADLIDVQRADIWALGVFLYKLCYYTTPFEEHGPLAILSAQYKVSQGKNH